MKDGLCVKNSSRFVFRTKRLCLTVASIRVCRVWTPCPSSTWSKRIRYRTPELSFEHPLWKNILREANRIEIFPSQLATLFPILHITWEIQSLNCCLFLFTYLFCVILECQRKLQFHCRFICHKIPISFHISGWFVVDLALSPRSRRRTALVPAEDDLQGQMLHDPRDQGQNLSLKGTFHLRELVTFENL